MTDPKRYWFHNLPDAGTSRMVHEVELLMIQEEETRKSLARLRALIQEKNEAMALDCKHTWAVEEIYAAICEWTGCPDYLRIMPRSIADESLTPRSPDR